jgi:flagellar hook-associated protein 3 FlgL
MRITENLLSERYLYNQNKINEKKLKIQSQITNNTKLERLSDNVGDSLEAIKLDATIRKIETFQKNITYAKDYLIITTDSIENIADETQKIISQIMNADNALNNANLSAVTQSIKLSLRAIVDSLNEKRNDMYLFGGTDFSNTPWSIDANGRAVRNSTNVTGEIKVQITQNIKDTINVTGNKIEETDLINTLNDILDSLETNSVPDDTLKQRLNNAYNSIVNLQSINGEKLNRLDDISSLLEKQLLNTQELLSKKQDIDPAKLIVDLQYQDYVLQLSYKLAATILPKSLLDYL